MRLYADNNGVVGRRNGVNELTVSTLTVVIVEAADDPVC
jgi:hypothetical protein